MDWISVNWPSLVGYPIASFLLVAGLGIVLRVKWLELQLIYRTHFQRGKLNGGVNANTDTWTQKLTIQTPKGKVSVHAGTKILAS